MDAENDNKPNSREKETQHDSELMEQSTTLPILTPLMLIPILNPIDPGSSRLNALIDPPDFTSNTTETNLNSTDENEASQVSAMANYGLTKVPNKEENSSCDILQDSPKKQRVEAGSNTTESIMTSLDQQLEQPLTHKLPVKAMEERNAELIAALDESSIALENLTEESFENAIALEGPQNKLNISYSNTTFVVNNYTTEPVVDLAEEIISALLAARRADDSQLWEKNGIPSTTIEDYLKWNKTLSFRDIEGFVDVEDLENLSSMLNRNIEFALIDSHHDQDVPVLEDTEDDVPLEIAEALGWCTKEPEVTCSRTRLFKPVQKNINAIVESLIVVYADDKINPILKKQNLLMKLKRAIKMNQFDYILKNASFLLDLVVANLETNHPDTTGIIILFLLEVFKKHEMLNFWCSSLEKLESLIIHIPKARYSQREDIIKAANKALSQMVLLIPLNYLLMYLNELLYRNIGTPLIHTIELLLTFIDKRSTELDEHPLKHIMKCLNMVLKCRVIDDSLTCNAVLCMSLLYFVKGKNVMSPFINLVPIQHAHLFWKYLYHLRGYSITY